MYLPIENTSCGMGLCPDSYLSIHLSTKRTYLTCGGMQRFYPFIHLSIRSIDLNRESLLCWWGISIHLSTNRVSHVWVGGHSRDSSLSIHPSTYKCEFPFVGGAHQRFYQSLNLSILSIDLDREPLLWWEYIYPSIYK